MDHYPLNTKFLKKNFNPKTLINVRNSLKISLFQDAPTTNKRICHPKFAAFTLDGLPQLPP